MNKNLILIKKLIGQLVWLPQPTENICWFWCQFFHKTNTNSD